MKNLILSSIAVAVVLLFADGKAVARESVQVPKTQVTLPTELQEAPKEAYVFNHGPYIQGLTEGEATIFFTTSSKGFSWVEARKKGSDESARRFVTARDGLIEASGTRNAIRIDGLEAAADYEYRLVSKEMVEFRPYKVTYGDSIVSPWYGFRTTDPATTEFSFIVISDIHGNSEKYRTLVSHLPMERVEAVFLNGDTMDYQDVPDQPYGGFVDTSVELFATEKPFVAIRGNHETRGRYARDYHNYVYLPEGKFYGLYRVGDTAIVALDSGEDKPDGHPVYAGIVAFDDYLREQAGWLEQVVESERFTSAKHRIVLVHIPPVNRKDPSKEHAREADGGAQRVYDLFVPILNRADIDLMMSGHTHRQMTIEPKEGMYEFPIVVNDNRSASLVHVSPGGISVRTVDTDGNVTLERTF